MKKEIFKGKERINFSEEELRQAACTIQDALLGSLPEANEVNCDLSEGFKRRMEVLIRKNKFHQVLHRTLQSFAAALLLILMCSGIWLAFDTEARADFLWWVRNAYENSIVYEFFGGWRKNEMPEIEFGWLPEGYTRAETNFDDNSGYVLFDGSEGEKIVVMYEFMYSGLYSEISDFDNNLEYEKVWIGGIPADFYFDPGEENSNVLLWMDEDKGICFIIISLLDKTDMIKIAENIT